MADISNIVKSIQNIMRTDTGVDGDAQRISQLVWMLFLKVFDAKEEEFELESENYKSPIPEKLRWRSWATDDEGLTGEELMLFINNELFPTLKELDITTSNAYAPLVKGMFEDAYNYMKSGTLLRQVVNKLEEINFDNLSDRHLFNDMYEQILKDLQSAGNAGEYYTPRAVTEFIVQMVDPKLGEKVFDPACGTGGFLISSINHIMKSDVKTAEDKKTLEHTIQGIEKKQLPYMLCLTNLILHDIETPNIRHDNSLSYPLKDITPNERVDCIVANPPFGGTEEQGIENNFPASYRTRETADLFLLLFIQMLKPRGRAGIVLPDGTLFGDGVTARIKEKLLGECNLHTIVRLPNGIFAPYTDINTNLLFFTKGEPTKEIWYYEQPLPQGYKKYTKTKPVKLQDFDELKSWWNDRAENEQAYKVDIDTIKANNFNIDVKNPHKGEEEEELTTNEIIDKIEASMSKSVELLEQIRKEAQE
ncbi:DNA methyltransferase [Malaciobacter halophilus]|uniref:site-specific DNA-methyltransferase (adenine-specific) n=1 Tax=Malaciobacter halophilus TaxID=197482 RepID=A0A2N1J3H9_9BACT|nr:N-6 DNA methylase [Malaciobacter halophilus]AXH09078.1 type I restriction/modification system, methylation subunit [Malaciobacter halophilus]PKI81125.1 DNA methyltransferase [Malaciobacter halophilus]